MPREVLGEHADGAAGPAPDLNTETPAESGLAPTYAGFFGKIPAAGDFVVRGLSPAFRRAWDGWVTRHLAPRRDGPWPEGGLRFRLVSGGRVAAGVVVPSGDSAGRRYPLSLIVIAPALPPAEDLDLWCDAALAAAAPALMGTVGPDGLWAALDTLAVPTGTAEGPALTLWRHGGPPYACTPDNPAASLDTVFDNAPRPAAEDPDPSSD